MDIAATLKQPSTILGIGTAAGAICGIVAHMLTGDTTTAVGAGAIGFAVVHVLMPDNSAEASSVDKLLTDAVTAATTKKLAQMIPTLMADGMAVVAALSAPAAVAAPQPAPTFVPVPNAPLPPPTIQPLAHAPLAPPAFVPAAASVSVGGTVDPTAILMNASPAAQPIPAPAQ